MVLEGHGAAGGANGGMPLKACPQAEGGAPSEQATSAPADASGVGTGGGGAKAAKEAAGLARVRRLMDTGTPSPGSTRSVLPSPGLNHGARAIADSHTSVSARTSSSSDEDVEDVVPFSNSRSRWSLLRKLKTVETDERTGTITHTQNVTAHKPKAGVKSAAQSLTAKRLGKDLSHFGSALDQKGQKSKLSRLRLREGAVLANKPQGRSSVSDRLRQVFGNSPVIDRLQIADIYAESSLGGRLGKTETVGTTSTFVLKSLASHIKLEPTDFCVCVRRGPGSPSFFVSSASKGRKRPANHQGPQLFLVEWVPPTSGTYVISVNCCGQPVRGSPFKFAVESSRSMPQMCLMTGPGLKEQLVGTRNIFSIIARDQAQRQRSSGGDNFSATISGPGEVRGLAVCDNDDGTYDVRFHVRIPGTYTVEVALDGIAIKGSPCKVDALVGRAHARSTILSGPGIADARAGDFTSFNIQACDRYGNQLRTGGANFTAILITARSQAAVKDAASVASVTDVTLEGRSGRDNRLLGPSRGGRSTETLINDDGTIDCTKLTQRKTAAREDLSIVVIDNGDGTYKVRYRVDKCGQHLLRVALDGVTCTEHWLPVSVKSGSSHSMGCRVEGAAPHSVVAGDAVTARVVAADRFGNLRGVGGDAFKVQVKQTGGKTPGHDHEKGSHQTGQDIQVQTSVVDHGDGSYDVSWMSSLAGTYQTTVLLEGPDGRDGAGCVLGSPFPTVVTPAEAHIPVCKAAGGDVFETHSGVDSYIHLRMLDKFGNAIRQAEVKLASSVEGPGPMAVEMAQSVENGEYVVVYNSSTAGTYLIRIFDAETDESIEGSPFQVLVYPGPVSATDCFASTRVALARGSGALCDVGEDPSKHWGEVVESVLTSMSAGVPQEFMLVARDANGNRTEIAQESGFAVELVLAQPTGDARQAALGQAIIVSADGDIDAGLAGAAVEAGLCCKGTVESEGSGEYCVRFTPAVAGEYQLHVLLDGVAIHAPLPAKVRPGEPCGPTSLAVGRGCKIARAGLSARFRIVVADRCHNRVKHGGANVILDIERVLTAEEEAEDKAELDRIADVKASPELASPTLALTRSSVPDDVYELVKDAAAAKRAGGTTDCAAPYESGATSAGSSDGASSSGGGEEASPPPAMARKVSIFRAASMRGSTLGGLVARAPAMGARVRKVHHSVKKCTINNNHDGSYTVRWMTPLGGQYRLAMTVDGEPLGGTPCSVDVLPGSTSASKCMVMITSPRIAVAGAPVAVAVEARDRFGNRRDAGGDRFALRLQPLSNLDAMGTDTWLIPPMRADAEDHEDGTYTATFVPKLSVEYALHVTFVGGATVDGEDVEGVGQTFHSDRITVVPASPHAPSCRACGTGLACARQGVRAVFELHLYDAHGNAIIEDVPCGPVEGDAGLDVYIECASTGSEGGIGGIHRALSGANGVYEVTWRPSGEGLHRVHLKVFGDHVPGSPFAVNVDGEEISRKDFDDMDEAMLVAAREAGRAPPTLWDPESKPPTRTHRLPLVSRTSVPTAALAPLSQRTSSLCSLAASSFDHERYAYRKQATLTHWGIRKMVSSFAPVVPASPRAPEALMKWKGRHRRLGGPTMAERKAAKPFESPIAHLVGLDVLGGPST